MKEIETGYGMFKRYLNEYIKDHHGIYGKLIFEDGQLVMYSNYTGDKRKLYLTDRVTYLHQISGKI